MKRKQQGNRGKPKVGGISRGVISKLALYRGWRYIEDGDKSKAVVQDWGYIKIGVISRGCIEGRYIEV